MSPFLFYFSHPQSPFLCFYSWGIGGRRRGGRKGQTNRSVSSHWSLQKSGSWAMTPSLKQTFFPWNLCSICCCHVLSCTCVLCLHHSKGAVSCLRLRSCLLFLFILHQHLHTVGSKCLLVAFVEWLVSHLGALPGHCVFPVILGHYVHVLPPSSLVEEGY